MLRSFLKMISAVPKFNIFDKCRADTELPIQIWRLKKATIKKHISSEKHLESSYLMVKIPNAACYVIVKSVKKIVQSKIPSINLEKRKSL